MSQLPSTPRITSIDAFRGFVMFLMLAEAMRLWTLHDAFPQSRFWAIVAFNTTHVPWQGCSLHDLIQPAFSFLVGAALPFSIASRIARGQSVRQLLGREYSIVRPGRPTDQRRLTDEEFAELLRSDFGPVLTEAEVSALVAALPEETGEPEENQDAYGIAAE
jgi:hypothetical protein